MLHTEPNTAPQPCGITWRSYHFQTVSVFWEIGAYSPTEPNNWVGTLKMAIKARDNLEVDSLLNLKTSRADLFYATMTTYEDAFEGETKGEERQREQPKER